MQAQLREEVVMKAHILLVMIAVDFGFLSSNDARASGSAECSVDDVGLRQLELLRDCDPKCQMCFADFLRLASSSHGLVRRLPC